MFFATPSGLAGGAGFGIGSINPGAQVPYGCMRLGPDTTFIDPVWGEWWLRWNHFGGYYYNDTHIRAFSHTHMVGPGASDWGDLGIMVTRWWNSSTYTNASSEARYRSGFSHDSETAVPGYYAVYLDDAQTYAELTVSGTHSGVHRYTCEGTISGLPCYVLLDVCHTTIQPPACPSASASITRDPRNPSNLILTGTVLQAGDLSRRGPLGGVYVYLYAIVSATTSNGTTLYPTQSGLWSADALLPPGVTNGSTTSGSMGAFASFPAPGAGGNVVITVRAGVSYVSVDSARNNLYAQQQTSVNGSASWLTFDAARAGTQEIWDEALSRVQITPPADMPADQVAGNTTVFYSAMYRTMLAPTIYSEADGSYMGMDQAKHVVAPGATYRSDMSIWDIHRSESPWLALVDPDAARDVANSLLLMAEEGGHLPRWPLANVYTGCMDGSHAVEMLAHTLLAGVPGVNASRVFDIVSAAMQTQDSWGSYATIGYVPTEESSTAASSTLEYAYDDGIAAVIASFVGEVQAQQVYANRSQSYRNIWNSTFQLFCPRSKTGEFACPAVASLPYPLDTGYVEGDALQYQTFVPHDQWGMLGLFSSPEVYVNGLLTLQTEQTSWPFGNFLPNPYYWAGNEPDILAPWQFAVAGNEYAQHTQYWTRWLLNTYYTTRADGVPGNDDFGTMSAWVTWAYLGLYPITGTGMFALGSPVFASASVVLPAPYSQTVLTVIAHNASASNMYVATASINGQSLASPFVNLTQLASGITAYDCGSLRTRGTHMHSWACSDDSSRSRAGSSAPVLEFFMTDTPVVFGTAEPVADRRVPQAAARPPRPAPVRESEMEASHRLYFAPPWNV